MNKNDTRIGVYISKDTYKKLKVICIEKNLTMSALAEILFKEYLYKNKKVD